MRKLPSFTLVLAVAVLAATAFARANVPAHDVHNAAMIDQRGDRFTLNSLGGRPVLVTFVATRCTDACPVINAVFARMQADIERRRLPVRLVTLTLDPHYDTPFVMARLARALNAHAAIWRLGSGSADTIFTVLHAFGVVVAPDAQGIPDEHSTFVYLLEGGRLTRTFPLSTNLSVETVLAHR